MLDESLGLLESFEVVGLSFAIPLFEGAKSTGRDDDSDRLSILGVYQVFLLEVGEKLAFDLHV